MSRAQCIVHRNRKILMVQHREDTEEYWCLPGGGIAPSESPDAAALRELQEECCVAGRIVRATSVMESGIDDQHFTFLVDIGDQEPKLGWDPEEESGPRILSGMSWLSLGDLSEVDRAYLWAAGLLTVPIFASEVHSWRRDPSYPKLKTAVSENKNET